MKQLLDSSTIILPNSFFGAVIIYLAVGAAYQYFVKGARGVQIIPNFVFWKAFVIYVLVSCSDYNYSDVIALGNTNGNIWVTKEVQ